MVKNKGFIIDSFLEERNKNSYFFVESSDIQSQLAIQPSFEDNPEYIILGDFDNILKICYY